MKKKRKEKEGKEGRWVVDLGFGIRMRLELPAGALRATVKNKERKGVTVGRQADRQTGRHAGTQAGR